MSIPGRRERLKLTGFVPSHLHRPLAAVSLLGLATGIGAVLVFLTQTLLARQLGPADYGLFASSSVTVTMVAPLACFGLGQFRLKVYGAEGWAANRWLRPSLRFTAITSVLALAVVVVWAMAGARDSDTRFLLLVLSPVVLSTAAVALVMNRMRLEDRYRSMALWQLITPASRFALVAALLAIPPAWLSSEPYRWVAVGYCALALAVTLMALPHLLALMRGDLALTGHGPRDESADMTEPQPTLRQLWSQAWPYGVAVMLYPILFQVGTVLTKYLSGNAQAGMFGLAVAVLAAIYLIPTTIYYKYLVAKLHRWSVHDKPKFWQVYRQGGAVMLLLGLVIGVALALSASWVVPLVFGQAYGQVATLLLVLSPCVPLRFLTTAIGSVLLTEDHMRYRVYATAVAVVFAIGLNAVLIPPFQAMGAAIAAVIGEVVLLLVTCYCVRRFVKVNR